MKAKGPVSPLILREKNAAFPDARGGHLEGSSSRCHPRALDPAPARIFARVSIRPNHTTAKRVPATHVGPSRAWGEIISSLRL